MADNFPDVTENAILDYVFRQQAWSTTGPLKLLLMTATGTDSAAGTEVATGGGYTAGTGQSITFSAASSGSITNSGTISFTNMPRAETITGIEIYDSSGTPKRLAYGALASSKAVGAGDTLQFAASSITFSLT